MTLPFRSFALTPIAATGGRFADFAPYVASINDDGVVAFQASLSDGHSGVFTGDGTSIVDVAVTPSGACPARRFSSHPDINRAGRIAVYATLGNGDRAVLLLHPDGRIVASDARDRLGAVGPLGPTMNERDEVAVRATLEDGRASVLTWRDGRFDAVAEAGDRFIGFEGLPVVNDGGQVMFRANLPDGQQGIFVQHDASCAAIATTGREFQEIGRFPIMNGRGVVAFAATRTAGGPGIFAQASGRLNCVVAAEAGFDSFRGVLINNAGPVAFYATPAGGQLGIYCGANPARHRVVGLGSLLFGATVVDFALNPVSVNEPGQLAIRVVLDDRRQFILRGDPQG